MPTHVSCVTSSVAPSLPGLPFRDGEGEQRWGLHEEELPGDAWLHETFQPAHHPGRRAYVKVRDTHIDLIHTQTQYRAQQSSHGYVCYLCLSVLCALFFFACAPCITILSTDEKSKHPRVVCTGSKNMFPHDIITLNFGCFDIEFSEAVCTICSDWLLSKSQCKS